jgi:hypothetical protein
VTEVDASVLQRVPADLGLGRDSKYAGCRHVVLHVVGDTWTIEECSDRDTAGARVGAILQALIACEPIERRPSIHGWRPLGFVPPQVTIVSAKSSPTVLRVRRVGTTSVGPRLSSEEVLYWRGDVF